MAKPSSEKIVAKLCARVTDWADREQNRKVVYLSSVRDLERFVEKGIWSEPIVTKLGLLGTWFHIQGQSQVLRGDVEGWREIGLGYAYHAWSMKFVLRPGGYRRNDDGVLRADLPNFGFPGTHFPLLALAFGQDEFAKSFLEEMEPCFTTYKPERTRHVFVNPLRALFIFLGRKLWSAHDAALPPLEFESFDGLYRVVDTWKEGDSFVDTYAELANWHLQNAVNFDTPAGIADEMWYVFPLEILAVQTVRRRLNLSATLPSHPLFDLPLASLPSTIDVSPDNLLARMIQQFFTKTSESP